ncbi:MAG: LacI family transcriptional regulator [Spirochaetaceae bacterium]|nr:MAG: LacI family transcriptional regulator [Spirochaetaceae bacterium]
MNSNRWPLLIAVAVLLAVAVLAWPRIQVVIEPRGGETVYVVLKTTGPQMEFWQIVRAGMEAAATEFDVEPVIVGPKWEKDIDHQIEILAEVIEKNPHGILLAASDFNRLVPLAERAAARGITIVTLDSALNSEVPVSFVATDNVSAGLKAGREIQRLVPAELRIALVSHIQGVATAIEREQGVRAALESRGADRILGTYYSQNEPELAYRFVRELVETYPDLGGIVAMNESSTVGAGRALRDLGVYDRIHLVGFDNSREEIEFLEKGVVKALVVQRPFNMGYLGIRTLAQAIRRQPVDPVIHTDAVLVRQSDMFSEENQKLLFPIVQGRLQ